MQCSNCNEKFSEEEFNEHICDYDENCNLIEDIFLEEDKSLLTQTNNVSTVSEYYKKFVNNEDSIPDDDDDDVPDEFVDHPCLKLLEENNKQIHKWFQMNYKLDLPNKTSLVAAAATSSNIQVGNSKKNYGPHACTMCDRKFVHASGLNRHMEKHEQDRLPAISSASVFALLNAEPATRAIMVVSKCSKCFRIFNQSYDALEHYFECNGNKPCTAAEYIDYISEDEVQLEDEPVSLKIIYSILTCNVHLNYRHLRKKKYWMISVMRKLVD